MSPEIPEQSRSLRGGLSALGCFLIWGLVPIYWKQMEGIDAVELISHRVAWSLLFLLALVFFRRGAAFQGIRSALAGRKLLGLTFVSGGLLTINWLTYVWAVNHNYVIESSLGYFLVPLVNVALGSAILGERLRMAQWLAISCAALGVAFLFIGVGRVPWIALALAGSWGLYGFMRKRSPLGAIDGLLLETILYAPFAFAYLAWRQLSGAGALGHVDLRTHVFILSAGWVTALPLILFAYGARRIRLSTLGLLQYLTPSVQFLLGLYLYREPFDATRLRACAFIWCGLAIYTADGFWAQRRLLRAAVTG